MKVRKRISAIAFALTFIMSLSVTSVFAATEEVYLPSTSWRVESNAIEGNYAKVSGGYVYEESKLPVWFVIECSTGGYHDVAKEKVSPAHSPKGVSYKGSTAKYRLELNPYGTETDGCKARGAITVTTK